MSVLLTVGRLHKIIGVRTYDILCTYTIIRKHPKLARGPVGGRAGRGLRRSVCTMGTIAETQRNMSGRHSRSFFSSLVSMRARLLGDSLADAGAWRDLLEGLGARRRIAPFGRVVRIFLQFSCGESVDAHFPFFSSECI